jgi:hypothetical protein
MCGKCNGCNDCSEKLYTSDVEFNGEFNNIVVPEGSDVNDVMFLIEQYIDEQIGNLDDLTFTFASESNIGLAAGTYSYAQVFVAINETIGTMQNDITQLQSDLSTAETNITNLQNELAELPQVYKAKINQTGTNSPVETSVAKNDINGVWSYNAVGTYYYTKTGAFTDTDKVHIQMTNGVTQAGINTLEADVLSADIIRLRSWNTTGDLGNGDVTNLFISIEVYP